MAGGSWGVDAEAWREGGMYAEWLPADGAEWAKGDGAEWPQKRLHIAEEGSFI